MASWAGWEDEFLDAAQVLRTAGARRFLDDWHAHAQTDCRNNPLDLNEPAGGSTDCSTAGMGTEPVQRYTSHGNAAHAFDVQLHRPASAALLAALESGFPYEVDAPAGVVDALSAWGSLRFARFYAAKTAAATGTLAAPHALGGWKDLRKSINRGMPDALTYSQRLSTATLRSLARTRKVRV